MTISTTNQLSIGQITIFTLINIFNYLDRYLVNAVLPLIAIEFSLNHSQQGQVASAFVIGYTLFSPLFGILGDRIKRPPLLFIGVVIWSIATIFSGLAASLIFLFLARILVGIGEASFGVIAPGYIKDFTKDPILLNKRLAIFYIAIPVGSAIGYVLGGQIAAAYDWRAAFYIAAIPTIFLSILLLKFPENTKRNTTHKNPISEVKDILKIPIIRYTQIGYIFNTFCLTSIAAFISSFGTSIGFSLENITTIFGIILVLTGIVGTLVGSYISSRMAKKNVNPVQGLLNFITFGSLVAVPFVCIAFTSSNHYIFLVCTAIAELCIFASLAPINTVLVLSAPSNLVTLTQGLTVLLINIFGALFGPLLVGYCADLWGLSYSLQLTTLSLFCCVIAWNKARKLAS
jgi:MFS family permease